MSQTLWVVRSTESEEKEILEHVCGWLLVYNNKEQALHDTHGMILINGKAFEIAEVTLSDVKPGAMPNLLRNTAPQNMEGLEIYRLMDARLAICRYLDIKDPPYPMTKLQELWCIENLLRLKKETHPKIYDDVLLGFCGDNNLAYKDASINETLSAEREP
jgi:hypothetical protein